MGMGMFHVHVHVHAQLIEDVPYALLVLRGAVHVHEHVHVHTCMCMCTYRTHSLSSAVPYCSHSSLSAASPRWQRSKSSKRSTFRKWMIPSAACPLDLAMHAYMSMVGISFSREVRICPQVEGLGVKGKCAPRAHAHAVACYSTPSPAVQA